MATPSDDAPFVTHESELWQQGFVMIPNLLLLRADLSPFDKLLWGYLSHIAKMRKSQAVESLRAIIAHDLAVTEKTVTGGMRTLQKAPRVEGDDRPDAPKLVVAKRRGQGRTNLYLIATPEGSISDLSRQVDVTYQEGSNGPIPPSSRELSTREEQPLESPVAEVPDSASSEDESVGPPTIGKVDGRNLALDALMEVCGWDMDNGRRVAQAATALNGRFHKHTGKLLAQGITHLYWLEVTRFVAAHPDYAGRLQEIRDSPVTYGDALATAIRKKADRYRYTMPRGTLLTPTALAAWWLDIEKQGAEVGRDRGTTTDDIDRMTFGG